MFDEGQEFEWDCDDELEPIPYPLKKTKKTIAVVDCETDPFLPEFLVQPFAIGFETPNSYVDFWGDDCVEQFFNYLETLDERYIIYAHNGGKFDFFFFLKFLAQNTSPRIINGRLVQIFFGKQEFRDSYALIAEPLAKYQKDQIDYQKFRREVREKHKPEIRKYLQSDCHYLYELVSGFHERYGDKLTAATTAMAQLQSFHGFEKITSDAIDEKFREYYYGGRVQCFENGILKPSPGKRWLIVDRNSMYAAAMCEADHPISATYELTDCLTERTDFATIIANSKGALPMRADNGSLDFPHTTGRFFATIHEIRAGIETDTLEILEVESAWQFDRKTRFTEWANHFYALKAECKANGDVMGYIFNKHMLTDAYGKFALNPRKFKSWQLTLGEVPDNLATEDYPDGWTEHSHCGEFYIWERPSPRRGGFYNIATAASITGAARANLLRNLALSDRPIYCDTDSIICEAFGGNLHDTELGGWKLEADGNLAAIAGKKLYAIYDDEKVLKKASKGCKLEGQEIIDICNGASILYRNPVPSFHLHNQGKLDLGSGIGSADFVKRTIRMTGGR
jgi:hypothetical protein